MVNAILLGFSFILCSISCSIFFYRTLDVMKNINYRRSLSAPLINKSLSASRVSIPEAFFRFAENESLSISLYNKKNYAVGPLSKFKIFDKYRYYAGISKSITIEGICEARLKFALIGSLIGFLIGALVSLSLSLFLGFLGFVVCIWVIGRWIFLKSRQRADEMEKSLSEMLDVLSICLKSGLSFDMSIGIYCNSFDTSLSRDFLLAKNMWQGGLKSREEALRNIADSYDSRLFSRTIESIIRSLRLGTSLTEGLVDSSREARAVYKSKREEEVSKAPVKMMIPTGTLILPAMLILILGPVLLELAYGGF